MFDYIIHTALKQRLLVLGVSLLLIIYGAITLRQMPVDRRHAKRQHGMGWAASVFDAGDPGAQFVEDAGVKRWGHGVRETVFFICS